MTILSQSEIIEYTGGWPAIGVVGATIVIFLALAILFGFICKLDSFGIVIAFVATFAILLSTQSIWDSKPHPTGRYEYKVIFDETYPVTQLYEKYEIIDQDGKIWIIQEKESKD